MIVNDMRAQLIKVADQLEMYARNHEAKAPPQLDKAEVNWKLAAECREVAGRA